MSFLLNIAGIYIPSFVKKKYLLKLFNAVSEAFHSETPDLSGCGYKECLRNFAETTRTEAGKALQGDVDLEHVRRTLFNRAYQIGGELRSFFSVKTKEEAGTLSRILYKGLGIDFRMNSAGEISIVRCYFGDYYTPEICGLISSLDEGILAGISGGGKLEFHCRITEGEKNCRAFFKFSETGK
jgi:hypothetical protein